MSSRLMVMQAITNTRRLLIQKAFPERGVSLGARCMSKLARENKGKSEARGSEKGEEAVVCWRPHPVSGIYFPAGQEEVMESIPKDAASLDVSYWLRGSDMVDVEKPLYYYYY